MSTKTSTPSKRIYRLDPVTSSKADEYIALREFAELCPPGTFLADLFTPKMLSWVEQNMTDDVSPDLFDAFLHSQREVAELYGNITALNAEITSLKDRLDSANTSQQHLELQVVRLETSNDQWHKECDEYQAELQGALSSLRNAEQQILQLKARLYDLEHPSVS